MDTRLDLIKGHSGALVREKVVAAASRRLVILVGRDKLVPVLGSRGKLPIEVVPLRQGSAAGGLFLGMAHTVLVWHEGSVTTMVRPASRVEEDGGYR